MPVRRPSRYDIVEHEQINNNSTKGDGGCEGGREGEGRVRYVLGDVADCTVPRTALLLGIR